MLFVCFLFFCGKLFVCFQPSFLSYLFSTKWDAIFFCGVKWDANGCEIRRPVFLWLLTFFWDHLLVPNSYSEKRYKISLSIYERRNSSKTDVARVVWLCHCVAKTDVEVTCMLVHVSRGALSSSVCLCSSYDSVCEKGNSPMHGISLVYLSQGSKYCILGSYRFGLNISEEISRFYSIFLFKDLFLLKSKFMVPPF